MQTYKRVTNIPMEALRSVVCIADTGSLTKAGMVLGLSQPALSAQLKKIESLIGGSIFRKTASGSVVTELGKLVLLHARRVTESNDQLLRLRGDTEINRSFRLGIANHYAEALFHGKGEIDLKRLTIVADHSAALLANLLGGFIDAALVLASGEAALDLSFRQVEERDVRMVWVRSKDFLLSPGSPIPLLTWPGQVTDEIMSRTLEKARMSYRISFSSPDHHATLAAARAGTGLMVLPADVPAAGLVQANEYYLPQLPAAKLLLVERRDSNVAQPGLYKYLGERFFSPRMNAADTPPSAPANPTPFEVKGGHRNSMARNEAGEAS